MSEHAIGCDEIDQLTEAGHLDASRRDIALVFAGVTPDAAKWHRFLSRLFLLFGVTLLIAAVGYFVAYNWDQMGRFARIALLEIGVIAAALAAVRFAPDDVRGRAALLGAVLLTGPLLAFIGQTYQTGADTHELFLAWALLAVPWVWVAHWRPLWCVWLLIVNVALALYFAEAWRPWLGPVFDHHAVLAHLLGNALFLVGIEWMEPGRLAGAGRSAERLALALVMAAATFLTFHFLFDGSQRALWEILVAIPVFIVVWCGYRLVRLDLVALALWSFAAIAVAVGAVGKIMFQGRTEILGLLLIGVATIGLSAWSATWLRKLHRMQEGS